jgi:flagellar protein FlaG
MDFNIPPVGGVDRAGSPPRSAPASKSGFGASLEAAVNAATLPASPPPSVLEDMHVAGRVAADLRERNRELHFDATESGSVVVQVRDLDGNVIRTIPPVKALEIAAGGPVD